MIQFIDVNNGRTYNGDLVYSGTAVNLESSYVHWFDGSQSTEIIYIQKLCIATDKEYLSVKLPTEDEGNPIFKLLKIDINDIQQNYEEIHDFKYIDLTKLYAENNFICDKGTKFEDNLYVHMIYFAGFSPDIGEFREYFHTWITSQVRTWEQIESYKNKAQDVLAQHSKYFIGADFHDNVPELKINLGNLGVDIPDQVIDAVYPSNLHDEAVDNILLNRKYKELLMDYIDILGNRGSYNSLIRSLDWFEYPKDVFELKEIWKHEEWGKTIYNDQSFSQYITDQIKHTLSNYSKTTYLGIFCALEQMYKSEDSDKPGYIYDIDKLTSKGPWDERVPELKKRTFKWSVIDMALKLSLLGNFYETYFMPVHLDLICSTLEDIVFTNSIKLVGGCQQTREDYVIHDMYIKSNIDEYNIFQLGNVNTAAGTDTLFVNNYDPEKYMDTVETKPLDSSNYIESSYKYDKGYDIHQIIGVGLDEEYYNILEETVHDGDQLKSFMLNYYNGIGVVVPIKFYIPANDGDIITKEQMWVQNEVTNKWEFHEFEHIFVKSEENDFIEVDLNFLCTQAQTYVLKFAFHGNTGQPCTKNIMFTVTGDRYSPFEIYKVKPEMQGVSLNADLSKKKIDGNIFKHYNFDSTIVISNLDGNLEYVDIFDLDSGSPIAPKLNKSNYYTQYLPYDPMSFSKSIRLYQMYVLEDDFEVQINETQRDTMGIEEFGSCWKELLNNQYYIDKKYKEIRIIRAHLNNAFNVISNNFDTYVKECTNGKKYKIFVQKKYNTNNSANKIAINTVINTLKTYFGVKSNILFRKDDIFLPGRHYLEKIDRSKKENTIIEPGEIVCVVPRIKYLKYINDYEWSFINQTTKEVINMPSIKEPFVLPINDKYKNGLRPGYYDIVFRYSLSNRYTEVATEEGTYYDDDKHEVVMKGAFIQQGSGKDRLNLNSL